MKYEVDFTQIDQLDSVETRLRELLKKGPLHIKVTSLKRKRTLPQNAALHLYTEMVAQKMNGAGITQRELVGKFKEGFELPVTCHMIKDIFREVGKAMFKKDSTSDLLTTEMQGVYKIVDQRIGEITGILVDWPSRDGGIAQ